MCEPSSAALKVKGGAPHRLYVRKNVDTRSKVGVTSSRVVFAHGRHGDGIRNRGGRLVAGVKAVIAGGTDHNYACINRSTDGTVDRAAFRAT
jgi:hypothetical protein